MPNIKEIALRIGEKADEYADAKLQSKGEFHPNWHTVRDEYFAESLIAELANQNETTPEFCGYAALGTGQYLLYACPATGELPPELVISVATEDEKSGRVIGDLEYVTPGTEIHPKDMAVRLAFISVAGLDALEQQLRILREASFPDTLPHTASQPVAWYDGNKFYANETSAFCGCADLENLRPVFTIPPTAEQIAKQNKPCAFLHEWIEYHPFGDTSAGKRCAAITSDEKPFDSSDTVSPLFTFPPTAEQIANETAEAIAKMLDDAEVEETHYCMNTYEEGKKFQFDMVEAIRSGAWKEFK